MKPTMRLASRLLLAFVLFMIGMTSYGVSSLAAHAFSEGLEFLDGTQPSSAGIFESTNWTLDIVDAGGAIIVTLNTPDSRLWCNDLGAEIPTWWRVWDNTSAQNGKRDPAKLADSGWVAVSDFVIHWNDNIISIPQSWSGEIYFQLKMERSGLGDPAGYYSTDPNVIVSEGA